MRRISFGTFRSPIAHFPQVMVHILAKPVENALPEALQGGIPHQPLEDQS